MRALAWGAVLLCAAIAPGCTCRSLAGAGPELEEAARGFAGPQTLQTPGGTVHLTRMELSRILGEPDHQPPRVVFWADGDGTLEGSPPVQISYLGLERVDVVSGANGLEPRGPRFPNLAAVIGALSERWRAEAAAQSAPAGAPPPTAPTSWTIRAEPQKVLVTEGRLDGSRRSSTLIPDSGKLRFEDAPNPDGHIAVRNGAGSGIDSGRSP